MHHRPPSQMISVIAKPACSYLHLFICDLVSILKLSVNRVARRLIYYL